MDRRGFVAALGASFLGGCSAAADTSDTIRAKVDLHSHLYHDGSEEGMEDQTVDTQQMVATYEELGFDVLVGTDHHYEGRRDIPGKPDSDQVIDYQRLTFDGPIIDGVELSEEEHVNLIRSENEEIRQINHPRSMTPEEILDLAERTGAELVEVTSRGRRVTDFPTPTDVIEDLPGLKPTMTTDAHSVQELRAHAESHVIVEVPELTGDHVIRALRRGDYSLSSQLW